jgi:hypothetical protein
MEKSFYSRERGGMTALVIRQSRKMEHLGGAGEKGGVNKGSYFSKNLNTNIKEGKQGREVR